jgi:putative membrane protein insertion efficiency factor
MTAAAVSGAASAALRGAVLAYQYAVRPVLGCNCRFHPSCSDYALDALRGHGAARGAWLAGRRILRCNPWHPGGFDPVPPPQPRLPAGTDGKQG